MQYDNKNSFVLFTKNNANPKAPAYSGVYTDANGKEWEISGWKKVSKAGNEFISGKISEKREGNKKSFTPKQNYNSRDDEDISF
jgi:uncharacterized protein (DUF736 family)